MRALFLCAPLALAGCVAGARHHRLGAPVATASEPPPQVAAYVAHAGPAAARLACSHDPDVPGLTRRRVELDGHAMNYLAYAPTSYDPALPTAVVVALHGAHMTAEGYEGLGAEVADAKGFLLLVPEGSVASGQGFTWAAGDALLVGRALDDLEACYSVDPRRRFVEGYSSGGAIAYLLGLGHAERFAGVAVSAGSLFAAEAMAKKTLVPGARWRVPVSLTHGIDDPKIPIASSRLARDRLAAAGHPVHLHEHPGGHDISPALFAETYDDLATSRAP